jgi:hypothetical protein
MATMIARVTAKPMLWPEAFIMIPLPLRKKVYRVKQSGKRNLGAPTRAKKP